MSEEIPDPPSDPPKEAKPDRNAILDGVERLTRSKERPEKWRARIRANKLIRKMQAFALDEKDGANHVKMTRDQITAANILLKKVIPDLSSVELKGSDKPIDLRVRWAKPDEVGE